MSSTLRSIVYVFLLFSCNLVQGFSPSVRIVSQPSRLSVPSSVPSTRFGTVRNNVESTTYGRFVAGPATIEREEILTKPGILDTPLVRPPRHYEERETQEPQQQQRRNAAWWEVRIYNDGLNTREHVARCLVQITDLCEYRAYQTMMHAHHHGMATVGRYVYEIAELYHDQLKTHGLICDIIPVDDE
jgi:ATP-dependent Clp protease adapter protein ClpS